MINEEVLLKNGYKEYKNTDSFIYRNCNKFYQKTLSDEPVSKINVYYYDKFKEDGSLDYEFEWILESDSYCKLIYGLDKNLPLEEVEEMLTR
jgi:hypothetical protein